MAGKPIEIPISVTADSLDGIDKVTDGFKDVEDSLKDLDKAGSKAADNITDDMSDAAKSIDRDLTKALDDVEDKAKTAGKGIGDGVKKGTDKAGEGFKDMREESASTAKEAAASFGGIEDAGDALQETLANAFVGFGPAGMAAGLLAAAGVGLVISGLTENAEKINENKERMLELAQVMKENGGKLDTADFIKAMDDYGYSIRDTKEWFELFQEDAVSGFEELRDGASKAGVSIKDAFLGQFGSVEDAQKVLDNLDATMADLEKDTDAAGWTMDEFGNAVKSANPGISEQLEGTRNLSAKVREHIEELKAAEEIERIRAEAIAGTTEELHENIQAQEKATDAVKNSLSAEMDYLDGMEDLNAKLAENGATLDINTAKGRENQRAVLDQAAAIEEQARAAIEAGESADVVTAKFQAQRDTLVNQVMPAFGGSREKAQAFIDTILKTPPQTVTNVLVNDIDARNKLDALTKARTAPLQILPDGSAVERWYTSQQGKKIFIEFAPKGGGQAIAPP